MHHATLAVLVLALVPFAASAHASDDLPTGTDVEGECVWLYSFPDAGQAYCVDKDDSDDCLVYSKTITFLGGETRCEVHDP